MMNLTSSSLKCIFAQHSRLHEGQPKRWRQFLDTENVPWKSVCSGNVWSSRHFAKNSGKALPWREMCGKNITECWPLYML
jgi:hypothetical protein